MPGVPGRSREFWVVLAVLTVGASTAPTVGAAAMRGCVPPPTASRTLSVLATGATPNDASDDTAAIQAAVERIAGTGGTVLVPRGTFRIDALVSVRLRSRVTLRMARGAVLQALPNASANSAVVSVRDARNVNVVGGTIVGERRTHTGTGGEWGHGLEVMSSQRVAIQGVRSTQAWGDGFYVGGAGTRGVVMCGVTANGNRRQGLSITTVTGMIVRDSVFKNTHGTPPETGIDIEPNAGEVVDTVLLQRNVFTGNAGGGIQLGAAIADRGTTFVRRTRLLNNRVIHNGDGSIAPPPRAGIRVSVSEGTLVQGNVVRDNLGMGIAVQYSSGAVIRRNAVTGTRKASRYGEAGAGIAFARDTGSTCRANSVRANHGPNLFTWESTVKVVLCTR